MPEVRKIKRPWAGVAGPAGATLMAMKELRWKMSSAFNLMSETGEVLDIREEAPSTLNILVERAITK